MRLAVLIPDRGDRPYFLKNFKRMLAAQTLQPDHLEIIDYPPKSDEVDITERYRTGYDNLAGKGFDLIALMENDDWYSPHYLLYMVGQWVTHKKPDIFGANYTIYYHVKKFKYFTFGHYSRCSAMGTFIKADLSIKWCEDNNPFADLCLWHQIKNKKTFKPSKHYTLGIKHGNGLCGGRTHTDLMSRFINKDYDKSFLKSVMDPESFKFYSTIGELI